MGSGYNVLLWFPQVWGSGGTKFDPSAYADIRIDSQVSPWMLEVGLKASKTDPFRRGVTIHIGWTGDGLYLVAAALDYMVRRRSGQGPLFLLNNGRYLTRE